MILLLGYSSALTLKNISSKLQQRGVDSTCFDITQFPVKSDISTSYYANGKQNGTLRWQSKSINFQEISSVFYWHPGFPQPHEKFTNQILNKCITEDIWRIVNDTLNTLNIHWLPGTYEQIAGGQCKTLQLKLAGELEFLLPPTLITNDPQELLFFYTEHNGNIISKMLGTMFVQELGRKFHRYTEFVTKRDIKYAHTIRYCPMIFQAYIPKRAELRITVVGKQVFAAAIDSQGSNRTRYDWRHYDDYATSYQPYSLPDEIEKQCIALVEKMDLTYGAIDMILTPEGQYIFLEINPAGQYGWIEEATGLPITDAICDLLIAGK